MDETQNMKERIVSFIKEKKETIENLHNEARMKQEIVLPLLEILGWNTKDTEEVMPECAVGGLSVDYSLRISGTNKVFIETKRPGETLTNHEEQLLEYAFRGGVPLAILTNGRKWWFYLPLGKGPWEERKFCMLDIIEEQNLNEAASRFIEYLSKENVASGEAEHVAEEIYEQQKKKKEIERILPEVWNEIITEQNEELVKLLAMAVKNRCGHEEPDNKTIRDFLPRLSLSLPEEETQLERADRRSSSGSRDDKKDDKEYWMKILSTVAEIVVEAVEKKSESKKIDISEIKAYRNRKRDSWYGTLEVSCNGEKLKTEYHYNAHMKSLGDILASSLPQKYPDILQKCSGKTLVFHCKPVGDEKNFTVKLWVEVEQ